MQKLRLDGSFTTLVSEIDGAPLHGANDIVFDPEGGFYFTDTVFPDAQGNPRAGHVCYATMDGRARRVHSGLLIPNGIGLTEDAKTLIVGETQTGKLIAFDVRAPGSLGPPRDFAQLTGGGKPDGLCLDAEGNVITTALGVPALQVFGDLQDGGLANAPDIGDRDHGDVVDLGDRDFADPGGIGVDGEVGYPIDRYAQVVEGRVGFGLA